MAESVHLYLPATSANLGPGFDALGLALDFGLHIDASQADAYRIDATGRNAAQCGDVDDSLVLETYRSVLSGQGLDPVPLRLTLHNEIPLGMGCGSSAAALVAGVALASHFGHLRWTRERILTEASLREGHPDNVAACVLGGLTVSAMHLADGVPPQVDAISMQPPVSWPLLLVLPKGSLSTSKARALLPSIYSREDTIANLQSATMLTAAFATGRGDLLRRAMRDRIHQPYRSEACPLLPLLLPLAGESGVLGVALSGAGPSVLLILENDEVRSTATGAVRRILSQSDVFDAEIFPQQISQMAQIGV